jgi:hypothetical protein
MKNVLVRKSSLHASADRDDLKGKSPQQLLDMMWQLALDAWGFKNSLKAEPRLQRHIVVLKKRRG